MQTQLRTDHDHRAPGIIDPFAEQVLAEAAGFALEHVAQGFERPAILAGDRAAAPAVIEQGVDGLLQHALLVADDHVRRAQFHQPLQAIIAVDHPAIEVVQIGGRETAAVERHQRPQIGRDDRDDFHHHPFRPVARAAKGVHNLQPLGHFFAPHFGIGIAHFLAQLFTKLGDVDRLEQLANGFGAHLGDEFAAELLHHLAVAGLGQKLFALERRLTRIDDDVRLKVEDLLDFFERHVEQRADPARQALEKPDVHHRRGELDMAHALAAHLGLDDLDATLLADHAAMAHALILAAIALVILGRPENFRAEEPVALGFEGSIIDRLGFFNLAVRPRANLFRRRHGNFDRVESDWILWLFKQIE